MFVEGVGLEGELSVINCDEEYGFKDRLSETVIAVASKVLAFSSNVNCLIQMTFAPIHSNEYGQKTSAVQEVAKRLFRLVILTPTWMATLTLVTLSSLAVVAANRFHSSPYRTTVGSFNGDSSKDPVVGLLNPRMLSKLSSQKMAGISVENERFDRLVSVILDNKPDVLFLPEMNRFAASALASKLKENYHYIFTGMGEKIIGEDTSFFLAFRGDLIATPEYVPFKNQNLMMERGFFVMETKDRIYVSTYRPNANDWSEIFARDFKDKQVVLMGEMDPEDAPLLIEQGFVSKTPPGTELKTSLTYEHYHGTEEGLDTYEPFFYVKNIENMADVVPMHSEEKLSEALSDHALILHR